MTDKSQEAVEVGAVVQAAYVHGGVNEGFVLPRSLSPYIVMTSLPQRGVWGGGGDGVYRQGRLPPRLTTPTVSTWDQFRPDRAWTLMNLGPPTALNIQFKGPAID